MALTVETGTGSETAEAYISVADADTRRTALGANAAWTALTTAQKEAALRKGAEYLEQRYSERWKGRRLNSDQALSWPRYDAWAHGWYVDSDSVPVAVKNANADLAVITLTDTLNEALERGIVREKVGPLETEYDAYSPQTKRYPAIDQMLAPYLTGGGSMARVGRA